MSSLAFKKANKEGKKFEEFVMNLIAKRGFKVWANKSRKYEDRAAFDFEFTSGYPLWRVECKLDILSVETGNFCFDLQTLSKTTSHYWVHGYPTSTGYQSYMIETAKLKPYCYANKIGGEFGVPICVVPKRDALSQLPFTRIS